MVTDTRLLYFDHLWISESMQNVSNRLTGIVEGKISHGPTLDEET